MKPPREIHLHIERLVIDGDVIGARSAEKMQASVVTELTRLFAKEGVAESLSRGGAVPILRPEPIRCALDTPCQLGTQIGRSVHRGLGR